MEKLGCQSPLRLPSAVSCCFGMARIYNHISIKRTHIRQAHTNTQCTQSAFALFLLFLFSLNKPSRVSISVNIFRQLYSTQQNEETPDL